MTVALDDAKIQIRLDPSQLERDLENVDKDIRRKRENAPEGEGRGGAKRARAKPNAKRKKGKIAQTTSKAVGLASQGLAAVTGVVAVGEFLGPVIIDKVFEEIKTNVVGSTAVDVVESIANFFGADVDLDREIRMLLDDWAAGLRLETEILGKGLDLLTSRIDGLQKTADFARNAALLNRPPGLEQLETIWDKTSDMRYAQAQQERALRSTRTQEMLWNMGEKLWTKLRGGGGG